MKTEYSTFAIKYWGEEIRRAMEDSKISNNRLLTDLCTQYGKILTDDALKKYKSGKREMPLSTALAISTILKMDINDICKKINKKMPKGDSPSTTG